jgi:hypothetical protein
VQHFTHVQQFAHKNNQTDSCDQTLANVAKNGQKRGQSGLWNTSMHELQHKRTHGHIDQLIFCLAFFCLFFQSLDQPPRLLICPHSILLFGLSACSPGFLELFRAEVEAAGL